jgi:hypothetical protein
MEDQVEELDQLVKDHEYTKKIRMKYHQKTKPMNHGCKRKRRDTNLRKR